MKVWVGPDGRTVATVGIEQALDYQLEAASSSADLSWRLASTAEWRGGYNQQLSRYLCFKKLHPKLRNHGEGQRPFSIVS